MAPFPVSGVSAAPCIPTCHIELGARTRNLSRGKWSPIVNCASVLAALLGIVALSGAQNKQEGTWESDAARLQIERATSLSLPVELCSKVVGTARFRLIPRGTFLMGSERKEIRARYYNYAMSEFTLLLPTPDDETPHRVTLTKDFYIGTTEVTNQQFRQFRPTHNSGKYKGSIEIGKIVIVETREYDLNGDDQPVRVTWQDAMAYCDWLTAQEGLPKGAYRLPSEAEWEYACRAGTETQYYWGDNPDDGNGWENFCDLSCVRGLKPLPLAATKWDDGYVASAPVSKFKRNPWGLYDMQGNESEWCLDVYAEYPREHVRNPGVDLSETRMSTRRRVVRGAHWGAPMWICARSATRLNAEPDDPKAVIGFRVVRELKVAD